MKVRINNADYVFRWKYGEESRERIHGSGANQWVESWLARMTYCDLMCILDHVTQSDGKIIELEKAVAFGTAECSRRDNFSREAGRRQSLIDVMRKAGLTQPERTLVWDAYFKRAPGKDPRSSNVKTNELQGTLA